MRVTPTTGRGRVLACLILLLAAATSNAQAPAGAKVLILNSFDRDTEPYAAVRDAFIWELQDRFDVPVAFVQFDLQRRQYNEKTSEALQARLLRNQHMDSPPDLVVAIGPPATAYWLALRNHVFPDPPLVAIASELVLNRMTTRPGDVVVENRWTFREVADNILRLLPATRRILVVFGSSQNERLLAELAREDLRELEDRVEFLYSNDMSLQTLQQQLADLGPNAAVLYGIFDSDTNDLVVGDRSGLALVNAASSSPVFGFFSDQVGRGIVGGPLIPLQRTGREVAASAEELLRNGSANQAVKQLPMDPPTYDWRELREWGIDTAALPPGSIIRFKPPSLWEQHSRWILVVLAVLATQTALILALLVQRRRLRTSEEMGRSLGNRLITAHEDERRRIARELHDDVSQRLARLSIDLGMMVADPGSEAAVSAARDMRPELARLGRDLHNMSYRLHPSLVDELGIAAALRNEVARVRHASGVNVVEQIGGVPKDIPRETGLTLYRIAQEAMRNAVRHGTASRIELGLECRDDVLTLTVRDDGCGFDPRVQSARHSLGLYSMRERARQRRGWLNVRSSPGMGTTVIAAVPLKGASV